MDGDDQAPDWDSDETVIEGSVSESDHEDEELPWRRLFFDQETSLRSKYSFRPDVSGIYKGIPSPEIPLGFKLRKDLQEKMNKNTMPVLNEGTVLQQPQDETTQNQDLLQTRKNFPLFTVSLPHSGLALNHPNIGGPEAENTEILPHPEKELSEDRDSPEISLLSGTAVTVSDTVAVKEKSLIEPEKTLAASNTFSESGKEIISTMTSDETKDEESSCETFVSALERLLTSPKSTEEKRLFEIMNEFDHGELMNPLSDSLSSTSVPLNALSACCKDLLENTKDDALPAELLAAINTLSEDKVGLICSRKEQGSSLSGRNECLEMEPDMSQTDEDCTQIVEMVENTNPFRLQTLTPENATSCEPLNNESSNPMENTSNQKAPCVLRRSSRLKELKVSRDTKHTNDMYKMPEKILTKILSHEDQISNKSSTENCRIQAPVLMIEDKGKSMHSSRLKSEQIRKNERLILKNERMKMSKMSLSSINRRNIFGENLLYKAAVHNDADLVHHYIKKGGNVNQPSYAGWTALHEASVGGFYRTASELLKGGADVNIKGMYQITPLHDAVINGHHKVAELLLLNGADPLFRNDNGKCALDEAKDSCMRRLLEKYVPKHQKYLKPAQRNNADPVDGQDVQQHKRPKFSFKNHTEFVCNENSNRQKPEHIEINKGSKENLLVNKEDLYEHCPKNSETTKFGKSMHEHSTVNQVHSVGLKKNSLHNIKDRSMNVSKSKGRKNIQHQMTQVDDGDCNSRQAMAVSSSEKINKVITHQPHTLQALDVHPEESCELSSPPLSSLKNKVDNNIESCSISKETNTHNMALPDRQEMQFLKLDSVDQTNTKSFSEVSLHKEIRLPLLTTDQQPQVNQEQDNCSYKSHENSNSGKKHKSLNTWENSFLSFVKEHFENDDNDCCTFKKAVSSKKVIGSTKSKKHCNYRETITNRAVMDFQQLLPSEDHFSQKNELKAGGLTTLPQQEAVTFFDSSNTDISEQHVANYEPWKFGTSFDHSHCNSEQTSLALIRMPSTHEVSKLTSHVEVLKKPEDNSPREPTPLMNQTDTHNMEKVDGEKKQDTERNYTDEEQNPSSPSKPFPTVVYSQVIEITTVEKRKQDCPESEPMHNIDFQSTENMNIELTNISQLNQKEEEEVSHKPDEELTHNISGEESTVRSWEKNKEKMDSEVHMPPNTQEHKKVQNFRKRQSFLKAVCNQEMNIAGTKKRNARGESQLHLAARRGNLTLVKALIESGADVNLKDNAGWTPLHMASNKGSNDIIIELLKAGANVNCENMDGILPLHDAVASNHLKAAEILLQHGANPNQKDQNQKTALDKADDEKLKGLLKSYGAIETNNTDESNATVTVQIPAVQSKRYRRCFCDDDKTVDPPSPSHQPKKRESLLVHQTVSAILQDIEEKQENLLKFEIRNNEDAEQYIEKMLEIKEVMDNVLAKQKAERDDLAKKYRVSIESFKHGALREQLANLAIRQKNLLVVAKRQKTIRLKIQNYKNVTSFSGLSLRKLPSISDISSEKDNQELTTLENSVHPQLSSLSPVNLACGSIQETPLPLETLNDNQNTNIFLNSEAVRREEFSGNEINSKQNVSDYTLDELSKSRHSDVTESSQPIDFITQTEYSQEENDLTKTIAKAHGFNSPSAVTGTINISECTSAPSQSDARPSTVIWDQDLSYYDPKRRKRKTGSQQPCEGPSESLAHHSVCVLGTDTMHELKPSFKKTTSAVPCANNTQISSSSESGHQHMKKPLNHSITPKKKTMQIKDLILLGRINPGNNILEFKTQETTHKASVLLSGKLKVENGKIYQNPVTWLKDLLGSESHVTWNYAWSKVTYLGKELLKYVSEEVPVTPAPNVVHQQHKLCVPGILENVSANLRIVEVPVYHSASYYLGLDLGICRQVPPGILAVKVSFEPP